MRGRSGGFLSKPSSGAGGGLIWHSSEVFSLRRTGEWPTGSLSVAAFPSQVDASQTGEATFYASVSASQAASITWQKSVDDGLNWQDVVVGPNLSVDFNSTLVLTGLTVSNNDDLYRVVAKAGLKEGISGSVRVLLEPAGSFLIEPTTQYVNEFLGTDAVFTTSFAANKPQAHVFWQRLTSAGPNWMYIQGQTEGTSLTVSRAPLPPPIAHQGEYYRAIIASPAPANFVSGNWGGVFPYDGVASQAVQALYDEIRFIWGAGSPSHVEVPYEPPSTRVEQELNIIVAASAYGERSGDAYPIEFYWQVSVEGSSPIGGTARLGAFNSYHEVDGLDWSDPAGANMADVHIEYPLGSGDRSHLRFRWKGESTNIRFRAYAKVASTPISFRLQSNVWATAGSISYGYFET